MRDTRGKRTSELSVPHDRAEVTVLILVTYIPALSTWLPSVL